MAMQHTHTHTHTFSDISQRRVAHKMPSSGFYSIRSERGNSLKTRSHLLLLLLLATCLLLVTSRPGFILGPVVGCSRLELDLNELAPSEDDATTLNEIKPAAAAAAAASAANLQMRTIQIGLPKTTGAKQAAANTWLQQAHYWRYKATNAISSFRSFKLPDYFDFERFRKSFKRKYSPSEYFYRKSVFLSKCVQVLKSRVAYRLGLAHHREGVNKFSDRSSAEFKRMFMSGPPLEFKPSGQSEDDYFNQVEREFLQRELDASEQVEFVSKSSLFGGNDNDYERQLDELARSFSELTNGNFKSNNELTSIEPVFDGKFNFNEGKIYSQLMKLTSMTILDENLRWAISKELESGASNEGFSQSGHMNLNECPDADADDAAANANANAADYDGLCSKRSKPLPWPGKQRSAGHNGPLKLPDLNDDGLSDESNNVQLNGQFLAINSNERLDWSEHKCFHQIYDQGDRCGKCYVMASTSLAEFYKCSEQFNVIDQRKFSKEFVLDCGQKYSPTTIMGCMGGSILDTLKFIALAGIYNIRGWKQRTQLLQDELKQNGALMSQLDLKCPFNKLETPLKDWGDIKVLINPKIIQVNDWWEALQDGPLVASVQMPSVGLDSYEGGVHDGTGCQTSGLWHSMILVGYGVGEQGIAYWRFRNSWGVNWGDAGHFNLARSVPSECLAGGVRVYREPLINEDG